ncbi:MAG: phage tail assembly protein [Proteobacteria bacterium]|nr:phage tail assembly protein [Pseudomonadota bacterium]
MIQTIKLKYSLESDGQTYKELNMRRSKVKDRLLVSKMKSAPDEEKEIRLFANLCEVTPSVIEELDESDYANLQKAYMGFFGSEGMLEKQSSFSQE